MPNSASANSYLFSPQPAGERSAENPADYDDAIAARLHDETGRILRQKIKEWDADRKWA